MEKRKRHQYPAGTAATVLGIAKAINSCNMIINAPMNAIICNTDAKVLTATAA